MNYAPFSVGKETDIELEAGRGCPYGCTFCSTSPFWGRKFRIKSVEALICEMVSFNKKYGVTKFSLVHDMFTANPGHLEHFCNNIIQEVPNFTWGCSSRVDVLNEAIIDKMRKANCKGIYLGIETGSPSMQKLINMQVLQRVF